MCCVQNPAQLQMIIGCVGTNWSRYLHISVPDSPQTYINKTVVVILDSQYLVSNNLTHPAGQDIRFVNSLAAYNLGQNPQWYDHEIVDGFGTPTTVILVRIPNLPAGNSSMLCLFGNPNASAPGNLTQPFDKLTVSGRSPDANISVDFFRVDVSTDMRLPYSYGVQSIRAAVVIVDGDINGNGRGGSGGSAQSRG